MQACIFSQMEKKKICFLTCRNRNCFGRGGHALAHVIVCCDVDAVHLATVHVVHDTVGVVGGAGDHQALLCRPFRCVVVSTRGHVPHYLADRQAVLSSDVLRDAWL